MENKVDQFVLNTMNEKNLAGLGLAVVKDGKIHYLKGYGWENIEQEIPVTSDGPDGTLFRWASMTKSLTAVPTLQLRDREELDLDAYVGDYLPGMDLPQTVIVKDLHGNPVEKDFGFELKITGRQLLSHTSGVQHYDDGLNDLGIPPVDMRTNPDFRSYLPLWISEPLITLPWLQYNYTSFGYNLLGALVWQIGENHGLGSYLKQIQDRIARPLGMETLSPDFPELENRSAGYLMDESGNRILDPEGEEDITWKLPSGGFVSTVEDMAKFCAGLMGEKLLARSTLEEMWKPAQDRGLVGGYGMGFARGTYAGENRRLVGHPGGQPKVRSRFALFPDEDLCYVVVINTITGDKYEEAPDIILEVDRILGFSPQQSFRKAARIKARDWD